MSNPPSKLIEAIRSGSIMAVSASLDDGADIEEADVHGYPGLPLRTACFTGNLAIVRELLTHGANPNSATGDGPGAPLRLALRCRHLEVAAQLLQVGSELPPGISLPPEIHGIRCEPLPVEIEAPVLPEPVDYGNMIEFTPTELQFANADAAQPEESFGTETRALSADLLFIQEDDDLPPLQFPSK